VKAAACDPVLLEVYRHRFESLCDEMGAALERSSFSANIKERRDYSCALFDAKGRMVAQGDHLPVHLGSMPLSVEAALAAHAVEPGDVIILNDPFRGGTHLPDITAVAPVHAAGEEEPAAFHIANRAHHSDVGGMTAGSMPLAREIYQEGLRIPPVRLVRRGETDEDLMNLILANVRTPKERSGDLRAQLAAVHMGRQRLAELVRRRGLAEVQAYAGHLQTYSERLMRATVHAIPDGEYAFEDFLDGDGFGREDVRIAVTIRVRGDRAEVDFSGTDLQVEGPMNANFAVTLSAVAYAFRCIGPAELPFNSGCFAPLRVRAPEGSVVNAQEPAAVCGGNVETSQRIADVVLGALSGALGDRIPAAGQGTMNNVAVGGTAPSSGEPFTYYETLAGGAGAGPSGPGASAVHTAMTNTRNTPIEALEHAYPLKVLRYAIRRGSGGEGRHRGGDGLVRAFRVETEVSLTLLTERRARGPWGREGGGPGAPGRNVLVREGEESELPAKTQIRLRAGDVVRIETPGGGAYGRPEDPAPDRRTSREEA